MAAKESLVLCPRLGFAVVMSAFFLSLAIVPTIGLARSPDLSVRMLLDVWPVFFVMPGLFAAGVFFLVHATCARIVLDESGISYRLKFFWFDFRHEASWDGVGHVCFSLAGFMAGYQVWGTTRKGGLLRFQFGGAFTNERQAIMFIVSHIDSDRVHKNVFAAIEKWKRKGLV